jgi:hypothetical protein
MKVKPLRSGLPAGAVDEPMTLWSAAVGDAAAAMKEGPLPSQRGRGGMWERARSKEPIIYNNLKDHLFVYVKSALSLGFALIYSKV